MEVMFYNTMLNFSAESKSVYDGLINCIELAQRDNNVIAYIRTQFDTRYDVMPKNGVPFSLTVILDRSQLRRYFEGKVIRLIPSESMHVSPTKLVEKDVLRKIADKIGSAVEQYGCKVVYRNGEVKADISIFIALLHESEDFTGYKVTYSSSELERAAMEIYHGLELKLPLDGRGYVYEEKEKGLRGVVNVYLGNINNRLDDAHLRSTDYIEKVIEGFFYGLLTFFKMQVNC